MDRPVGSSGRVETHVSPRAIQRLTQRIGGKLLAERAAQATQHRRGELAAPSDQPPVDIAYAQAECGRMFTSR